MFFGTKNWDAFASFVRKTALSLFEFNKTANSKILEVITNSGKFNTTKKT